MAEQGIHCFLCSYTTDVIDLFSDQIRRQGDVSVTSLVRRSAKGLSKVFYNSVVAMVTDL